MSQLQRIIAYCRKHGSITDNEAREHCGCNRLAARIYDGRQRGYQFMAVRESHNGGTHARYFLCENEAAA